MAEDKKNSDNRLAAQLAKLGYGPSVEKRADVDFSADDLRRAVRKRQRLAQRQTAAPAPPGRTRPREILYRRDLPRENAPPPRPARPRGRRLSLEQAVDGMETVVAGTGPGYVVTRRVREIEQIPEVDERFCEFLSANDSPMCSRLAEVCDPADIASEDVLFMDVESTGLGNSPLFLIGVMLWHGGGFEVRQFFARNYAEERAVIAMFVEAMAGRKLLVTFNGKSFDWPYIRTRAAATGIPFTVDPCHLDMLHVCRRIWRDRLPDCKLQTLERFICNRTRRGDIPGCEIPDAYHDYVRTNDAWRMVTVLKHNMLDLVTMADLMNRFPPMTRKPRKGAR